MRQGQQTILPPSHFSHPPSSGHGQMPMPTPRGMSMLAMLPGLIRSSLLLIGIVMAAEFLMAYDFKPSTLMGRFSGAVDTAELNAKQDAQAEMEKAVAQARYEAEIDYQAKLQALQHELQRTTEAYSVLYQRTNIVTQAAMQMEQQALQMRQQVVANSQGAMGGMANLLDIGCVIGLLAEDSSVSDAACGKGAQLRNQMANEVSQVGRAETGAILQQVYQGLPDPATLRVRTQ